jgi:hypothetical protein
MEEATGMAADCTAADCTAAERIVVPFTGDGAGSGPLTWGQLGIWRTIERQGFSEIMSGIQEAPPGTTIDSVIATWRHSLSRHQALRTRLGFDADGQPYQRVYGSGELAVEIVDVPDGGDPGEAARAVLGRYSSTNFDYVNEWPVRVAEIRHRGVLTHAVVVYNHLALDAHGLEALIADLSTMDADGGTSVAPVPGIPPLELARQQREPSVRRQGEASIRHWERIMRAIPARRFAGSDDPRSPRYQDVSYRTPAALLALRELAARDGTESSATLLAAFAVALCRVTGTTPAVTQLAVNNRFRRDFVGMVSPVAQTGLCAVDVADVPFRTAVARAGQAALTAYKCAYYDPDRRLELFVDVCRDRGEEVDVSVYFNDRRRLARGAAAARPSLDEIRAALSLGELDWAAGGTDQPIQKLYFDVDERADHLEFSLTADTHAISPADMTALLRGVETVLVEAALDPSATTGVPAGVAVAR